MKIEIFQNEFLQMLILSSYSSRLEKEFLNLFGVKLAYSESPCAACTDRLANIENKEEKVILLFLKFIWSYFSFRKFHSLNFDKNSRKIIFLKIYNFFSPRSKRPSIDAFSPRRPSSNTSRRFWRRQGEGEYFFKFLI